MYNFQLPNLDYNNDQSLELNTTTQANSHRYYTLNNNIFDYDNHNIDPNPLFDRNPISNSRSIVNILRMRNNRMLTIDEEESFEDYMFSDVK